MSYNYRELLLLQKRTVSFLFVYSVMIVVFFVFILCIQTSRTDCQLRADTAVYSVYARSLGENDTLVDALAVTFRLKGVQVEPLAKGERTARRVDVYDTAERTLANSGFRLVRRVGDARVVWHLRYLDHGVCRTARRLSMEALPNVDYEKVSYHVKAVAAKEGRVFLHGTDVTSRDRKQIATFQELQALFPGFNAHMASPRMLVTDSLQLLRSFSFELYYSFSPMGIEIHMEEQKRVDEDFVYWHVKVLSSNILAERELREVYRVVADLVRSRGLTCNHSTCGRNPDDVFLY